MQGFLPKSQAAAAKSDQELSILTEIGQILSSTLELREAFGKMMQIISEKLDMNRGALVLLDESTGRLRTEAATGMTPEEIDRGKYALGEGVTGNVVATGRARIIPDVRSEPDFLNRTGRLDPASNAAMKAFPRNMPGPNPPGPPGPPGPPRPRWPPKPNSPKVCPSDFPAT